MFFQNVKEGPPDAVFGLMGAFRADPRPQKVNLMVGVYKNELLETEWMPTVQRVIREGLTKWRQADYLPMDGSKEMLDALRELIFGKKLSLSEAGRIYGAQAIGGTGALRVGADFLFQEVGQTIWIPEITWPNHRSIFERARFHVESYPYSKKGMDFAFFTEFLKQMPPKSIVLLHAACHNPTGCDPTLKEWKEIAKIIQKKQLVPFFDFAYQGLGDGIEEDAAALRHFVSEGIECVVAYSCSKNFSLYCQRVGALFVVLSNSATQPNVASQIKRIIRAQYSNPPAFGAWVVAEILSGDLRSQWEKDLTNMRFRLQTMRKELAQRLLAKKKKADLILHQKGMFSLLDLEKHQIQKLKEQYAIYMLENGRINIAGLNHKNLDTVVESIIAV